MNIHEHSWIYVMIVMYDVANRLLYLHVWYVLSGFAQHFAQELKRFVRFDGGLAAGGNLLKHVRQMLDIQGYNIYTYCGQLPKLPWHSSSSRSAERSVSLVSC